MIFLHPVFAGLVERLLKTKQLEVLIKLGTTQQTMKTAFSFISQTLAIFLVFDLLILSVSFLQIGLENETGYWNPFWVWQAEQIISFLP